MRSLRERHGLTLSELLIVVTLIAILAAVGLPQYQRAVEHTHAAEAMNVLSAIRGAQVWFKLQTGAYATSLNSLDITFPASTKWAYVVKTPGVNFASAVRLSAPSTNAIRVNLDTGALCGDPAVYGLPPYPC